MPQKSQTPKFYHHLDILLVVLSQDDFAPRVKLWKTDIIPICKLNSTVTDLNSQLSSKAVSIGSRLLRQIKLGLASALYALILDL